ncbi:MAG: hypothetical protein QW356_08105 [Candidatus Hadarchaeales archaeon]
MRKVISLLAALVMVVTLGSTGSADIKTTHITATVGITISFSMPTSYSFGTLATPKGYKYSASQTMTISDSTTVTTDFYGCIDNLTYGVSGLVLNKLGVDNRFETVGIDSNTDNATFENLSSQYNTWQAIDTQPNWQNLPVPPPGGQNYTFYFLLYWSTEYAGTYGGTCYVTAVEHGTTPSGTPH